MTPAEVIDIGREALYVLLKAGTPLMLLALGVGLIIALFQALTQMQEMTLSFVPKIIAIFIGLAVLLPFMWMTLAAFAHRIFAHISTLG